MRARFPLNMACDGISQFKVIHVRSYKRGSRMHLGQICSVSFPLLNPERSLLLHVARCNHPFRVHAQWCERTQCGGNWSAHLVCKYFANGHHAGYAKGAHALIWLQCENPGAGCCRKTERGVREREEREGESDQKLVGSKIIMRIIACGSRSSSSGKCAEWRSVCTRRPTELWAE